MEGTLIINPLFIRNTSAEKLSNSPQNHTAVMCQNWDLDVGLILRLTIFLGYVPPTLQNWETSKNSW